MANLRQIIPTDQLDQQRLMVINSAQTCFPDIPHHEFQHYECHQQSLIAQNSSSSSCSRVSQRRYILNAGPTIDCCGSVLGPDPTLTGMPSPNCWKGPSFKERVNLSVMTQKFQGKPARRCDFASRGLSRGPVERRDGLQQTLSIFRMATERRDRLEPTRSAVSILGIAFQRP